jgi:hypothetical protein
LHIVLTINAEIQYTIYNNNGYNNNNNAKYIIQ